MPIGYAAVRVNITSFVVDGIDSDDLPDDRPLTAEVTFSPMIQVGKTLQYDDGGVTKLKAIAPVGPIAIGSTGDISNQGRDYVKLVAPTAVESNLSQLQWKATFSDIRLGGVLAPVKIDPIYFWVLPGDDINLADHVNVAASTAIVLSRGQRGYGLVGFDYSDGDLVALYESPEGIVESDPIPLPESGATSVDALLDAGDLGKTIVKADDAPTIRSAIGAASTTDASWGGLAGKPAVVAAGTTAANARQAIGAGTSNLTLGTTSSTAKPGDYVPTADDILAAGALTQEDADATYAPQSVVAVAESAAAQVVQKAPRKEMFRALATHRPVLTAPASPPTIAITTYSSTEATWPIQNAFRWGVLDGPMDLLHCVPLMDGTALASAYVRNTVGVTTSDDVRAGYAIEFTVDGPFAIACRAYGSAPRYRPFEDDRPILGITSTTVVSSSGALSSGNLFWIHVTPATAGPHTYRFEFARCGLRWIDTAKTTTIRPAKRKRLRVGIIGTSFSDNSGSVARILDSWVWGLMRELDVDFVNCARSGSGYVGTGVGTHADQLAALATAGDLDFIIAEGSGNDVAATEVSIRDAAIDLFEAIDTARPGLPVVVVSPGPRGSNGETAGTMAKVLRAMNDAVAASPNAITFVDQLGTVDPLPEFSSLVGVAQTVGARCRYRGSVQVCRTAHTPTSTFDPQAWYQPSVYTGTGYSGSHTIASVATTNTSTAVTSPGANGGNSFTSLDVGATVSGTGIQGGTTITAVSSAGAATLSLAATATGTITLTVSHLRADGTRDGAVDTDGTHPLVAGALLIQQDLIPRIRDALIEYVESA